MSVRFTTERCSDSVWNFLESVEYLSNLILWKWTIGTKSEDVVTRYLVYLVHLAHEPLRRARHFCTFEFSVCSEFDGKKILHCEPNLNNLDHRTTCCIKGAQRWAYLDSHNLKKSSQSQLVLQIIFLFFKGVRWLKVFFSFSILLVRTLKRNWLFKVTSVGLFFCSSDPKNHDRTIMKNTNG